MEADMYTNAQLIRKLREDRAWSQEHLAAVAGLSARTIQRVEAENSASRETRMAIAVALGIDLAQLNRAAEGDATEAAATAPPPRFTGVTLGRMTIVSLIVLAFGYTFGKDLAEKHRRLDCAAEPTQCAGR